MKIKTWAELKQVRRVIESQALARQQNDLAQQQALAQVLQEKNLFQAAVGKVQPLKQEPRAVRTADPTRAAIGATATETAQELAPSVRPGPKARVAPPSSSLSDAFERAPPSLDDTFSRYAQPGVGSDVLRKLSQGHWQIQRSLDLHGLRIEQARDTLALFIRQSQHLGVRCVKVVHGKGLSSPGQTPVLKQKVHNWLVQQSEVLAFVQAQAAEGGAGALVVLLQSKLKSEIGTTSLKNRPQ